MQQEIEATFVDVNHDQLRKQLSASGAHCEQSEYMMRRTVFDFPDNRLNAEVAWVRVRQEAKEVTVCYKQRQNETIHGMREIEFVASDYQKACDFLYALGLERKAYQESKRELWTLDDCQVTLDTWPWIPPIVEVEGPSEAAVKAVSQKLDQDWPTAIFDSADRIYCNEYDVTRTEISSIDLEFGPIPDWLQKRAFNKVAKTA